MSTDDIPAFNREWVKMLFARRTGISREEAGTCSAFASLEISLSLLMPFLQAARCWLQADRWCP